MIAMIKFNVNKITFCSLASSLLIAAAPIAVSAQTGVGITPQNALLPDPKKKPRAANVLQTEILKQKISIDGLPEYSGKQVFVAGNSHQTDIGGQYTEEFAAMEQPDQIIDWYKNALTSYKWEIISSDKNVVVAKKAGGASISVSATPSGMKTSRSRIKINFHDYHIKDSGDQ